MRSLDQARVYVEEGRINEAEDLYKKIRHQENLKPLNFLHRILNQEYSNKFDETGRDIGRRAAFMEARYKLPRAGLQYLKLIDNKVSPEKVETIHSTGVPLRERVEQIMAYVEKKDKVCILTDLDRRGKQLYETLKPIFQELGAKLDSTFRGILIKSRLSHIEGIYSFMEKISNIE